MESTENRRFTTTEISKLLGVPYSTLTHWRRSRFVVPSITDLETGKRFYTFRDLILLEATRLLRIKETHSFQRLRKIIPVLVDVLDRVTGDLVDYSILIAGTRILTYSGRAFQSVDHEWDLHLVVEVLHQRITQEIHEMAAPKLSMPGELVWIDGKPIRI